MAQKWLQACRSSPLLYQKSRYLYVVLNEILFVIVSAEFAIEMGWSTGVFFVTIYQLDLKRLD